MKNADRTNIRSLKLIAVLLCIAALACGGASKPAPPEYVGTWTGDNETTITIRSDGGADYKSANSSVSGGTAAIDESAKTLKITFMRVGPSFIIDKPPVGDEMTLSGVVYKKGGSNVFSNDTNASPSPTADAVSENPDDRAVQRLVLNSIADLTDAVETGDFTLFYEDASSDFRNTFTLEDVQKMFKTFVDKKADILPILKQTQTLEPEFSQAVKTRSQNGLRIVAANGRFETKPAKLNFETEYVNRAGEWKLLTFVVHVK